MVTVTYLPCFGSPVALRRLGNVIISSQIKVQLLGTRSFELQENVSCVQGFPSGCTAVSHMLCIQPLQRQRKEFEDGFVCFTFSRKPLFLGLLILYALFLVNEAAH